VGLYWTFKTVCRGCDPDVFGPGERSRWRARRQRTKVVPCVHTNNNNT